MTCFYIFVVQRRYARALKGGRISVKGNFTRGTRYSVLGALSSEGIVASHTITAAFDSDQFLFAFEQFILPLLGSAARQEPSSVVILDNCAIHKNPDFIEAVRGRGALVIFLP